MFINYDRAISFFFGKSLLKGWEPCMFKQKWDTARDRGVIRLFTTAKAMVWEGLSLLALSSKLPMKTMLFKQNLSSKFPRTVPFKQKLLFKIQLLWHIYTHKGLNDRIRFKTMLSMTKSWASFSWNPPLQHGSILVLQKLHWPCPWTHMISVARLQAGQIWICRLVINYL